MAVNMSPVTMDSSPGHTPSHSCHELVDVVAGIYGNLATEIVFELALLGASRGMVSEELVKVLDTLIMKHDTCQCQLFM